MIIGNSRGSLLPLLALFILSMVYLVHKFFQAEALFTAIDRHPHHVLSSGEWSVLQRRKFSGYLIRLCAVAIWGLEPIYIRYTSANDVAPIVRTFLLSIGVLIPSVLIYFGREF